jgi:hypothetical protein
MTAAVTVEGGAFRAPRAARARAYAGGAVALILGGVTLARSASVRNVLAVGEAAAARGVVAAGVVIALALLVLVVRSASLSVDDDGVAWGFGGLAFRVPRHKLRACRLYENALAVVSSRGSWYILARDYAPFGRIGDALRRAGLPVEEHARRAPFQAWLQGYGLALDGLLFLDVLAAIFLFAAA